MRSPGFRAKILDTRKTTPGWRLLEKYAVRMGGGANHRIGLYDGILIKDNHLAGLGGDVRKRGRGGPRLPRQRRACRSRSKSTRWNNSNVALAVRADIVLLDNMTARPACGPRSRGATRSRPACCSKPPAA